MKFDNPISTMNCDSNMFRHILITFDDFRLRKRDVK